MLPTISNEDRNPVLVPTPVMEDNGKPPIPELPLDGDCLKRRKRHREWREGFKDQTRAGQTFLTDGPPVRLDDL